MTASLHLVRCGPRGLRRLPRVRLDEHARRTRTPGLVATRLGNVAALDHRMGGHPTATQWGVLCGWKDLASRDAALANPRFLAPLTEDATESWTLALDTVRCTEGDWHGWRPVTDGVDKLRRDEPVVVMTHGTIRPAHLGAFTVANRRVVRSMAAQPGLELMFGHADTPSARRTFSLWRSQGDAVRFAYAPGTEHGPAQKTARAVPWANDFFFARFRPVASIGTWGGVDPLAALR